ncbi:hypothetical protein IEQ34_014042 [Dendrobium chrysotoxum]|uniref:Uncharacterized protein n=1 Tax=Dendrobium chrysotoxum TaxID=161865 RepID=A0AAV7G1Z5_DENCH|nr:hypothetical protein IEQ34_014042 [Dendrobium chrysotoxum]
MPNTALRLDTNQNESRQRYRAVVPSLDITVPSGTEHGFRHPDDTYMLQLYRGQAKRKQGAQHPIPFPVHLLRLLLNSDICADSPSLGKKASLSINIWRLFITFDNWIHNTGAQQKANAKTERALTTPSEYHGFAITPRAARIANQGVKTGSGARRNELIAMEARAAAPSK